LGRRNDQSEQANKKKESRSGGATPVWFGKSPTQRIFEGGKNKKKGGRRVKITALKAGDRRGAEMSQIWRAMGVGRRSKRGRDAGGGRDPHEKAPRGLCNIGRSQGGRRRTLWGRDLVVGFSREKKGMSPSVGGGGEKRVDLGPERGLEKKGGFKNGCAPQKRRRGGKAPTGGKNARVSVTEGVSKVEMARKKGKGPSCTSTQGPWVGHRAIGWPVGKGN